MNFHLKKKRYINLHANVFETNLYKSLSSGQLVNPKNLLSLPGLKVNELSSKELSDLKTTEHFMQISTRGGEETKSTIHT